MNIEDQVVSVEVAKKLKEIGVEQDSLWKWCIQEGVARCYTWFERKIQAWGKVEEEYSAFTVAELMEQLPAAIETKAGRYRLTIEKYEHLWCVSYTGTAGDALETILNRKLADALAGMLLWVYEDRELKVRR